MIFWVGGDTGPVEAIWRQTPWSVTFRGLVPKKMGDDFFRQDEKNGAKINSLRVFFFDELRSNPVSDRLNFCGRAHLRYNIQENQCSFGPRLF
jgi:hypothetical protein